MLKWIRPSTIKFPRTWRSFKGKIDSKGKQKEYWIQDFTKEYRDQVIQYTSYFLKEEPLLNFFGASHDNVVKELIKTWTHILDQNVSIVCLTRDANSKPIFAGINFTMVLSKNDTFYASDDKYFDNFFKMFKYINEQVDPYEIFHANEYLSAFGLFVLPEHRGNGIGYNFLETREALCKTMGVKGTATLFTSKYLQRSADKAGFKEMYTTTFHELMKRYNILKNSNTTKYPAIDLKFMYKSYT